MKKNLLFILILIGHTALSQTTIYSQDFETAMSGYSNTPDQTPATDPGDQYFSIANPSDAAIYESGGQLYTNVTNNSLFVGSNPNTINAGSPGVLLFDPINVGTFTNLEFRGDFGAVPNDWDASDNLEVQYNFDGGAWATLVQFAAGSTTNAPLSVASNAVGGINTAIGTVLTFDLITIASNNFTGTGAVLNLRILVDSNANYEAFAVDNIIVSGLSSGANAAPVITNISNNPTDPTSTDVVNVSADVTDADGLASVELQYGFTSGVYDQTPIAMNPITGDTYTATIAAQADGTTVYYRIVATDSNAMPETANSPEQSYSVMDPVVTNFVAVQDFDQSLPEWAIITNNGDVGAAYGRSLQGTRISNGDVLELASYNTTGLQDLELTLHNASVGGIENADQLEVYVSLNGSSFSVVADITIQEEDPNDGSFNNSWSYDAANGNVASTTAGNPAVFNGNMDNGYAIIRIGIPDNTSSVAVRIVANTNNATEYFYIDDITLSGEAAGVEYVYDGTIWTPNAPSDMANPSTTSDNILVLSGSVAINDDIDVRTITVEDMASLDLGTNIINLTRNLNAIGTAIITGDFAILNISGTIAQQINAEMSIEDVILNNANGISLNRPVALQGVLTLTNGVLTTNDNLTLKSTEGKSAIIAPVLSGAISGDVVIEQFYTNQRAFRFVGAPLTMSGTVYDNWQQAGLNPGDAGYIAGIGTQITGGTVSGGFDQSSTNNPSMFTYDNAAQAWFPFSSANGDQTNLLTLNAGEPVRLYIRGDRSVSLNTSSAIPTSTTLVSKGTVAVGDVPLGGLSTLEGGFNFMANPYQAQVNFASLLSDASTVDVNENLYYAWDPTIGDNGAYVTYNFNTNSNNVAGSEVNEFIQPSQAFFTVTAEDNDTAGLTPSITFKESYKTLSTATTNVYRNSNPVELLSISLFRNDELSSGKARDGIMMTFDDASSRGIDARDGLKITNPDENMGLRLHNELFSTIDYSVPNVGELIPLEITGLTGAQYTLRLDNSLSSRKVALVDYFLGTETIVNNGNSELAVFFDPSNPNSTDSSRFALKFLNATLSVNDSAFAKAVLVYPNPWNGSELTVSGLNLNENLKMEIFTASGQLVKNISKESTNGREIIKNLDILSKGVYLLQIKQGVSSTITKIIKN